MSETPKKDWSHVDEILKQSQEKSRAEMTPEQLAEELAEEELGKRMRGEISVRAEASKKEEAKNPEKIADTKVELNKIYGAEQPEAVPTKSTADLLTEARRQNESLNSESLARERAKIEKLRGMSPEEKLKEGDREQQAKEKQRAKGIDAMQDRIQKGIDSIARKFGVK